MPSTVRTWQPCTATSGSKHALTDLYLYGALEDEEDDEIEDPEDDDPEVLKRRGLAVEEDLEDEDVAGDGAGVEEQADEVESVLGY